MKIDKNIRYGPHRRQKYDLYLPAKIRENTCIIFLAHGGGWISGDKSAMNSLAKYLADKEHIVINLNYRLLQHIKNIEEQIKDYHLVYQSVEEKLNIDFKKHQKIVIGESAGAHLAFLSYQWIDWDGIISISGPLNFTKRKPMNWLMSKGNERLLNYLLKNQEKSEENWRKISPLYQDINIPTLLFQGESDPIVDYKDSILYQEKLTKENVDVQLIIKPEWGHFYRMRDKKSRDYVYRVIEEWILERI